RLSYTPNAYFDTADHYTHFLYNFLGDPETVFHTCDPAPTVATFPASIPLGLSSITVHVTAGGVARQNALVCLQKGTEEDHFGTRNARGDCALSFRAETGGSVQVTVSGQNMTTYQGAISVSATGGPYVSTSSMTINDSVAPANGNGDGVVDAGETLQLSV